MMNLRYLLGKMVWCGALAISLLSLQMPSAQAVQQPDAVEQYYQMLEWRNIGPERGGRSLAVAGSTERPYEYYFGAVGGGLWKTTDGGNNWRPVTDGKINSSSVGAVAQDPTNPDIIYLGMGEGQLRGNVLQGDGIYKSTDAGQTWRHMGLKGTKVIDTIRINPQNPDIVYAAALGDPYTSNEARGIFRSRDGGESWKKVLYRSPEAGAIDLAMDPNNPDILFATIWQVYRKPWKLWSGGPGSGIFKSTDGGDSWSEITRNPGLPNTVLGKMTIAVSGADSNRVYANIEAEAGGLYRSDDGGDTWQHINGDRKLWQRAFYFLQVRADPVDRDTVYVLSFLFEKSTDGGKSFSVVQTQHSDIHDLWIDPNDPRRMIVADDGGGSVTVNGGASWTEEDYPTAQIYRLATTNDFPYHVCGAQQDNSSICVPSRSPGRRASGYDIVYSGYRVSSSESGYIAPHPTKSGVFFTGATNALTRFDRASGRFSDVQPYPYMVMGEPAEVMPERWNWTYPIVFSPLEPHALYAGSQHLWRSFDEGANWEKISPDLTRADPETLKDTGGEIKFDQDGPEVYGTLYTIAPSPLDSDIIWTGSDDGLVHITRDGGAEWSDVTPPDLPANSRVSFIDASVHGPGAAYIAAKRYEMGDRAPYIWKTSDYGQSWTRIDTGLPQGDFVHTVRADPKRHGLLFAGSEHGVHVSFDDGEGWHSLALNLPDTPVTAMEVKGDDLVIATHGRSFYILENIAALRQIADLTGLDQSLLFQPDTAYRNMIPARIDFFLNAPVDNLRLEILDESGELVRRLRAGRRYGAGAHRVSWYLRHDGATVVRNMILEGGYPGRGPLAIAGTYQVRLTADGNQLTKPFTVEYDPRFEDVSHQQFVDQLELTLRVRDATSLAHDTIIEIRAHRAAVEAQLAGAGPELAALARLFLDETAAIEAELYQVENSSPKDKIALPIRLNNRLSGLLGFLTYGDGAPTKAHYEVFDLLMSELSPLIARYEAAKANELADLNTALVARGMTPVGGE